MRKIHFVLWRFSLFSSASFRYWKRKLNILGMQWVENTTLENDKPQKAKHTQEWNWERSHLIVLTISAALKLSDLLESNLLTLSVRLKAAVNHFLPCRHGENSCHHAQIGGWLKRRRGERKRKCCFSQFLSSSLLERLCLSSAAHPEVTKALVRFVFKGPFF